MYTKKILPEGWKKKVLTAVFLAVLGNILVQYVIPWPEFMTVSLSGVNVAYSPFIGRRDIQEGTLWDLAKMVWCDLVSVYISRRIWSVSWKLDPGDIRFCFWLAAFLGI